jgi:hypothetical protein
MCCSTVIVILLLPTSIGPQNITSFLILVLFVKDAVTVRSPLPFLRGLERTLLPYLDLPGYAKKKVRFVRRSISARLGCEPRRDPLIFLS